MKSASSLPAGPKVQGVRITEDWKPPRTHPSGTRFVGAPIGNVSNSSTSARSGNVRVSGAGTVEVNGDYTRRGTISTDDGDRGYFNLVGQTDSQSISAIFYHSITKWSIYDSTGDRSYKQSDPTVHYMNPWEVPVWVADNGALPVPTVTQI